MQLLKKNPKKCTVVFSIKKRSCSFFSWWNCVLCEANTGPFIFFKRPCLTWEFFGWFAAFGVCHVVHCIQGGGKCAPHFSAFLAHFLLFLENSAFFRIVSCIFSAIFPLFSTFFSDFFLLAAHFFCIFPEFEGPGIFEEICRFGGILIRKCTQKAQKIEFFWKFLNLIFV